MDINNHINDDGLPVTPFGKLLSGLAVIAIAAGFVIVVVAFSIIQAVKG